MANEGESTLLIMLVSFGFFTSKRKAILLFLVTVISLSMLVSSTYNQYYTLAAADFVSHDLKLENFDQDYMWASNRSELKASRLAGFSYSFQLLTLLFGQSSRLSSQLPSLNQKNSVLRC